MYLCRTVITQSDPIPTHTIEKDPIIYAAYYNRIWIHSLTKIRVLTVTGSSLKQRMWGIVLSYQAVTTTRITHNVSVLLTKRVKNGAIL